MPATVTRLTREEANKHPRPVGRKKKASFRTHVVSNIVITAPCSWAILCVGLSAEVPLCMISSHPYHNPVSTAPVLQKRKRGARGDQLLSPSHTVVGSSTQGSSLSSWTPSPCSRLPPAGQGLYKRVLSGATCNQSPGEAVSGANPR